MEARVTPPSAARQLGALDSPGDGRLEVPLPSALDRAILRTVTYAGLFQFPLSLAQLQRGLMDVPAEAALLGERLEHHFLRERLSITEGLIHPRGRQQWVELRAQRQRHTEALLARHASLLRQLAAFPFVRLVALSGSCAHQNAADDDVDVFLITRRGRAWSVCLALMVLAKLRGMRRTLCVNYILDEDAAALPERDLFTAAEIVGLRPLAGAAAYRRFVEANAWAAPRFPNFFAALRQESQSVAETSAPGWVERLLDRGPAQVAEAFARLALGAWLRHKAQGRSGVVLTPQRLKLHTQDHASPLLSAFAAALAGAGERSIEGTQR